MSPSPQGLASPSYEIRMPHWLWMIVIDHTQPWRCGEVRGCLGLNRQPVLLRQILQRHLWPGADVLNHFGGGECAEAAGVLMTGVADQADQESGGEQIAGAGGVDEFFNRKRRRCDDSI